MNIKATVVNGILVFIITAVLNSIVAIFATEQANIKVNNPVKISESEYQLNLNISNFGNSSLNGIRIIIPQNIGINELKYDKALVVNKVDSDESNSIFQIDRVGEDKNINIVVILHSLIKSDDISIEKNNNRIKVEYSDKQKNPLISLAIQACTMAFIYTVIMSIFSWRNNLKHEKSVQEIKDGVESVKKELKERQEEANKIKAETQDSIDKLRKKNLLLLSRVSEYKKELTFWKDTIRKMLYKKGNENFKSEELFKIVTKQLKTYQTQNEDLPNIDYLTILASVIKDTEDKRKEV